ncbi:ATP-binding protein [Antarcticirhabdus aurantiaca]|uniref:ATP-binding protein n=1 Tax=Antarcticirhabdus aurantiaca TaxID=2606717 RepID=A0ACD4NR43_9HYPH|nr:ATP-binding protein [Antarcticirhabdus aurantiaca]WAJ29429.1 ATP-binding protein [Jeongeuplla avenae]
MAKPRNDGGKPAKRPDLLARIAANQSEGRRAVAAVLRNVRSIYLKTDNDDTLAAEIEFILDSISLELGQGAEVRPAAAANRGGRILIVTGEAGAGKSRALASTFLGRPEFEGFGIEGEPCPLLSIVAPSPFTLKALGNEAVRKMGYRGRREIREGEVWPMARLMMRELGIRVLHIDEAQHGDQLADPNAVRNVENTLKRVLQDVDWPIWLILSGLPELAKFCQHDRSVNRRIRHVKFESLRFPDHVNAVRGTVATIMEGCPGLALGGLLTDEFVGRLLHASLNQFGILVEFVQDAIGECLVDGKTALVVDHFADVYTSRTGQVEERLNPFKAGDWHTIDVAAALYDEPPGQPGQSATRRQLKPPHRTGGNG